MKQLVASHRLFITMLLCALLFSQAAVLAAQAGQMLDTFGPIDTPQQAQATYDRAMAQLQEAGGGILVIPGNAPAGWAPVNVNQGVWRDPAPPAPARNWGTTAGNTVIDLRRGIMDIHVPQLSGMRLSRTFNLPEGQSSPHWEYHPMVQMTNSVIHGAVSYREWLREPVEAGADRRFYVNTIRGVFPGVFLNVGDYSGVVRLYVKSLGYDREKQMAYFVADTDMALKAGAIIHNKTHTNLMRMDTFAHTEDQTFDFMNWRRDYSQGDTYMFHAWFEYMGDVHSTAGDENGVLYASYVQSMVNPFQGRVESWDAQALELKYTQAREAHTLGSGRPIINMNPDKWVTGNDMIIVAPGHWYDVDVAGVEDPVFEGQSYPTSVSNTDIGTVELRMGGLIRFAADSPVDASVVGRYFAVDEPSERIPNPTGGVSDQRRWYRIHDFHRNEDGTKVIRIVRHWWGAKPAGAPTLYRDDNYTRDGHVRPLAYIIAPGANVQDVSRGVLSGDQHTGGALERILVLSPDGHVGSSVDFEAGDPILQAIGPDPFRPLPWRSWVFESVPGAWPAPIFDVANQGAIQRHSVLTVAGGGNNIDAAASRHDGKPHWGSYFIFDSVAGNGIVFNADIAGSAILFGQPNNRAQPITWRYDGDREASLTVDPTTGTMAFDGNGIAVGGALTQVRGVSGTDTPANNLRGINVNVPAGASEITVRFDRAEADAQYAIFVELSWLTTRAVTQRTAEGFTVRFGTAPQQAGQLNWMLVR